MIRVFVLMLVVDLDPLLLIWIARRNVWTRIAHITIHLLNHFDTNEERLTGSSCSSKHSSVSLYLFYCRLQKRKSKIDGEGEGYYRSSL